MSRSLPSIPVERLGETGLEQLAGRQPERLLELLKAGRRKLSPLGLALLDKRSKSWSKKTNNPYHQEIEAIDSAAPMPGIWFMNFCYEWGCTAGLKPTGGAPTLLRTLDWPFDSVGRSVTVAERDGGSGPYWLVTWPGHVGAITVMAPGRFSISINQAPMRRRSPLMPIDWLLDRMSVGRSSALPPAQLLRKVADEAQTFESAVYMLSSIEIALPVIFTCAGMVEGESLILERTEKSVSVREGVVAAANHWESFTMRHRDRGNQSPVRQGQLAAFLSVEEADPHELTWLRNPVLNKDTRLATVMDLRQRKLTVLGLEADGPATEVLHLSH